MRRRTVALLVAGRACFRLAQYGSGFVLLAVWGADDFARYAGAVGIAGWLFSIAASGVERAALLAVGEPGGRRLESLFIYLGVTPFALALLGWLAASILTPGTNVAADMAAAALATGAGFATVLVGLFRVRGRPYPDALTYFTLSATYVVVVVVAATTNVGVIGVFTALVVVVVMVDVALLVALWPEMPKVRRPRAADLTGALRMLTMLAAGEVLALAAVSVLFAELAADAPPTATSVFYICMLIGTIFIALWPYLLRLAQPRITAWVRTRPEEARTRIRRMVWLVATPGAVLTTAGVIAVLVVGSRPVLIGAALIAENLVMVGVATAAFLLEAIDNQTRSASALGAVVGFVVIATLGAWLIPTGGAAGALVAMCAGWTVRCPFLLAAVRSRGTAGSGTTVASGTTAGSGATAGSGTTAGRTDPIDEALGDDVSAPFQTVEP